jgi:hypothetical protein
MTTGTRRAIRWVAAAVTIAALLYGIRLVPWAETTRVLAGYAGTGAPWAHGVFTPRRA